MKKLLLFIFLNLGFAKGISGEALRIQSLLPELPAPLAIQPAIPEDFIALSPGGAPDHCYWTYWGPREVLEKFFEDQTSLKQPILRFKLSGTIAEAEPNKFLAVGNEEKKIEGKELKWGPYPVYASCLPSKKPEYNAWIGLNSPEGWVLQANLVYPEKEDYPEKEALELWNRFIGETKPLSDSLFLKAHGQELKIGSTTLNVEGSKIILLAERRSQDKKLQVVIVPTDENLEFQIKHVSLGTMGGSWHYGEPLAKISARLMKKDHFIAEKVISVLIKTVSEFSLDADELRRKEGIIVFQK